MNTFLDRLKQAMAEANKTKTDLWRACGISSGAVSQWFSKPTTQLKGKNLLCVARELGVSPEWLATGQGDKHKTDEADLPVNMDSESASIVITREQQHTLDLIESLDKEARDVLLKMVGVLARRPAERRKKNIGHDPERRLDWRTHSDEHDMSDYTYEESENQIQKRRKEK